MTPCEEKGYKVGDEFVVVAEDHHGFDIGDRIILINDDGSYRPEFRNKKDLEQWVYLSCVRPAGLSVILRTNGQPFATEASASQQLTARGLQGTHEVVPHEGGYALAPITHTGDPITLRPGDHVSTEGMTEEQYHAVARAFMGAGAQKGAHAPKWHNYPLLGWDARDGTLYAHMKGLTKCWTGRHLTIDQVLGATNAGNATPQPKEAAMPADPITLQPGDYVSTEGMTEEQYHAVARAFMAAGAESGEYPDPEEAEGEPCFGWSAKEGRGMFHGTAIHRRTVATQLIGRHLTIDQVLGAVNAGKRDDEWIQNTAGEQPVEDDVMVICKMRDGSLWRDGMPRPAGRMGWYFDGDNTDIVAYKIHNDAEDAPSQNDEADTGSTMTATRLDTAADPITTLKQARQARDEAEKAYQEALGEAREYLGEGFRLTEVGVDWAASGEDMTDPANWREGDVVTCISTDKDHQKDFERGLTYTLADRVDGDGWVSCKVGKHSRNNLPADHFRLHHRPA